MAHQALADLNQRLISFTGNELLNLPKSSTYVIKVQPSHGLTPFLEGTQLGLVSSDSILLSPPAIGPVEVNPSFLADINSTELSKVCTKINQKADTFLEEKGLNTLFVTLGVLNWTWVTPTKTQICSTPLLCFIPERTSVSPSTLKLTLAEGELTWNPYLSGALKTLFGISLPELPETLTEEELAVFLAKTINDLHENELLTDVSGSLDVYVGSFSIPGIPLEEIDATLYPETACERLDTLLSQTPANLGEAPAYEDDDTFNRTVPHTVLPSDFSQLATLMDVRTGRHLVIQGPPGTGKSQTIVNIIADSLLQKKKVLFLAQKSAALDVVYTRLKELNFGMYTLPVFSPYDAKAELYSSLSRTLDFYTTVKPSESSLELTLELWLTQKHKVEAYGTSLLDSSSTPKPLYELMGTYLLLEQETSEELLPGSSGITTQELESLESITRQIDKLKLQPGWEQWTWFTASNPTRFELDDMWVALAQMRGVLASQAPTTKSHTWASWQKEFEVAKQAKDTLTTHLAALTEANTVGVTALNLSKILALLPKLKQYSKSSLKVFNPGWYQMKKTWLALTEKPLPTNFSFISALTTLEFTSQKLQASNLSIEQQVTINEVFKSLHNRYHIMSESFIKLKPFGVLTFNTIAELESMLSGFFKNKESLKTILEVNKLISTLQSKYPLLHRDAFLGKTKALSLYKGVVKELLTPHLTALSRNFNIASSVSQLQELDSKLCTTVRNQLANLRPNQGKLLSGKASKISEKSGFSLIQHVAKKPKAHVTPHQLFTKAIEPLLELTPCFLMTPSTVSQLPRTELFDLVIIDESSQMLVQEAAGSLLRSKQWVIVGDSQQMPPTTWTQSFITPEDEDPQESILDKAVLHIPLQRMLKYHYRSEDSALIEFSNQVFYKGQLLIPPSARSNSAYGVKHTYVKGVYSKGDTPNLIEAQALVEAVLEWIKLNPLDSVGVVSLNVRQSDLIKELFNAEIPKHVFLQDYIMQFKGKHQPFFIKNLENVQGDERDHIFISTVFGPDEHGVVYQNFGLNKPGDEKRLNVLFTRARKTMQIYTSLQANQITSDTSGAKTLALFLSFCVSGKITYNVSSTSAKFDSPWEEWFYNKLSADGFQVQAQVGVGAWRIDLGVKHTDYPHGFICGIELDGAAYHNTAQARDRDITRESILEKKGWKIYRIWSTDFFNNPEGEYATLVSKIRARLRDLSGK